MSLQKATNHLTLALTLLTSSGFVSAHLFLQGEDEEEASRPKEPTLNSEETLTCGETLTRGKSSSAITIPEHKQK
jgi:hypothetical protein